MLLLTSFLSGPYITEIESDIWSHLNDLDLQFSAAENERISGIRQQREDALLLVSQAVEKEDRVTLKEGFNQLFSVTEALYQIFDQNCRKARKNIPAEIPEEFERAGQLEHDAGDNMHKAGIIRDEAEKAEDISRMDRLYVMALDLEMIALLNKARALLIYQDFPIVYEYQWFDDVSILSGKPDRAVRVIEISGNNKPSENLTEIDLTEREGISFIIQIAAHTERISGPDLSEIYSGNEKINVIFEDSWYKYYLGPYDSFEEAEGAMKSLNLRNAFIAAYLNGRRIGVKEAIGRQEQID
ncbi:MAG: SPOR domain-containing protein [Bacteroidales bacterium]